MRTFLIKDVKKADRARRVNEQGIKIIISKKTTNKNIDGQGKPAILSNDQLNQQKPKNGN